jgi:type IV secretory pathway VirB2 component (pilin)
VTGLAKKINIEDLFITLFLGAVLLPVAIQQFTSANTTGWSSTLQTIWDNIPVIGLVGVLMGIMYKYMKKR